MNITELKELAEKATPGPWKHRNGRIFQLDYEALTIANVARAFDGDYSPANGELLAAANPAAILELITRLEETQHDRDSWEQQASARTDDAVAAYSKLEDAQGEIRALRATEAALSERVKELEEGVMAFDDYLNGPTAWDQAKEDELSARISALLEKKGMSKAEELATRAERIKEILISNGTVNTLRVAKLCIESAAELRRLAALEKAIMEELEAEREETKRWRNAANWEQEIRKQAEMIADKSVTEHAALRKAIIDAEPVAWMINWPNHSPSFTTEKSDYVSWYAGKPSYPGELRPLYTLNGIKKP